MRAAALRSQVVESREAGEKLVAQLVKARLRHGYVDITNDDANDAEPMSEQKDGVGALSTSAQAAVAGEPEP